MNHSAFRLGTVTTPPSIHPYLREDVLGLLKTIRMPVRKQGGKITLLMINGAVFQLLMKKKEVK